jgi:glyoxylase-like metal-dependent hydrolase (beta-lactamase superfamily II)
MEIIIVSIGALSKNPLWNERVPTRTSHATTTLIRTTRSDEDGTPALLLVDPSLPGDVLDARLYERAGVRAEAITHVFLTNWRPVHRRGLERFSNAVWWMHPAEIEAAAAALDTAEEQASHGGHAEAEALIEKERALLEKVQPVPDDGSELVAGVDLYPLHGYTPGQAGLIIAEPTLTTVVAGDAVPTAGHFSAGQVFPDGADLAKAKESLLDLFEVADVIVPGHDNLFIAPRAAGL